MQLLTCRLEENKNFAIVLAFQREQPFERPQISLIHALGGGCRLIRRVVLIIRHH